MTLKKRTPIKEQHKSDGLERRRKEQHKKLARIRAKHFSHLRQAGTDSNSSGYNSDSSLSFASDLSLDIDIRETDSFGSRDENVDSYSSTSSLRITSAFDDLANLLFSSCSLDEIAPSPSDISTQSGTPARLSAAVLANISPSDSLLFSPVTPATRSHSTNLLRFFNSKTPQKKEERAHTTTPVQ